jgi:NADPH-dependent 2,4-dienoyl-CoA reductase/sulfur reductase-like enzyme
VARVVVVGASVAGVAACEALRGAGFEGELVVVGAEAEPPYDRPPLSKQLLVGAMERHELALREPAALAALRLEPRLGTRAHWLDGSRRTLGLDGVETLAYDGLVVATGASARRLPGQPEVPGVCVLRTLADALAIRQGLREGGRVVVVGAGFIGLEVASAARALGCRVTVVEAGPHPMSRVLPAEVAGLFGDLHARNDVGLLCGRGVARLETARERIAGVSLDDGSFVPCELVVVGVGATPNTDWLAGSGIEVRDGVRCDATLRAAPLVYACGDVARWRHPIFGEIRAEHWTTAIDQARVAGANLAADLRGDPAPRAVADAVPYFWSDQHGVKVQLAGWTAGAESVHQLAEGERRQVLFGRDGRLVAAMTWNWPRAAALQRRRVAAQTPWEEAIQLDSR